MKQGILAVIILIVVLIGVYLVVLKPRGDPNGIIQTVQKIQQEEQRVDIPVRLIIPKLNIDTDIEQVGLDKDQAMDVPKDVNNVGWYNLGFRPGELGNTVLAGHFDDVNGGPAVFFKLDELEVGDTVITVDGKGNQTKFQVALVETYKHDQVPLESVFGSFPIARLNLITCGGVFDKVERMYSERTVVYTRLDES